MIEIELIIWSRGIQNYEFSHFRKYIIFVVLPNWKLWQTKTQWKETEYRADYEPFVVKEYDMKNSKSKKIIQTHAVYMRISISYMFLLCLWIKSVDWGCFMLYICLFLWHPFPLSMIFLFFINSLFQSSTYMYARCFPDVWTSPFTSRFSFTPTCNRLIIRLAMLNYKTVNKLLAGQLDVCVAIHFH